MNASQYPHIVIDEAGIARIGSTRYKVQHLAAEHYHHGWTAEELLRQHPDLRPEEVYAALAYFYDHHDEIVERLRESYAAAEAERPKRTFSRATLLREYDFRGGERGKYAARYAEGSNVVVLPPDLARRFPTSEAVERALRGVVATQDAPSE